MHAAHVFWGLQGDVSEGSGLQTLCVLQEGMIIMEGSREPGCEVLHKMSVWLSDMLSSEEYAASVRVRPNFPSRRQCPGRVSHDSWLPRSDLTASDILQALSVLLLDSCASSSSKRPPKAESAWLPSMLSRAAGTTGIWNLYWGHICRTFVVTSL